MRQHSKGQGYTLEREPTFCQECGHDPSHTARTSRQSALGFKEPRRKKTFQLLIKKGIITGEEFFAKL